HQKTIDFDAPPEGGSDSAFGRPLTAQQAVVPASHPRKPSRIADTPPAHSGSRNVRPPFSGNNSPNTTTVKAEFRGNLWQRSVLGSCPDHCDGFRTKFTGMSDPSYIDRTFWPRLDGVQTRSVSVANIVAVGKVFEVVRPWVFPISI